MAFHIRPFQKTDFDALWRIDQICFDSALAYSRVELAVYMRRTGSFTLVAEQAAEEEKVGIQRPASEGAFDSERLAVSLKRYPDTKLSLAANGKGASDDAALTAEVKHQSQSSSAACETSGTSPAGSVTPSKPILGYIVAEARRKTGHIITIDVLPEARRGGLGSALLAAAEEKLAQSRAVEVVLEVAVNNAAAIRFYKQKGYFVEQTLPGYYSNGLDALVMRKSLAAGC